MLKTLTGLDFGSTLKAHVVVCVRFAGLLLMRLPGCGHKTSRSATLSRSRRTRSVIVHAKPTLNRWSKPLVYVAAGQLLIINSIYFL